MVTYKLSTALVKVSILSNLKSPFFKKCGIIRRVMHGKCVIFLFLQIRRQFFMDSMEPCMVRRMVAHFGQPGRSQKENSS